MRVFALGVAKTYAKEVCESLGMPLSDLEDNRFSDGEAKIRSCENVRNCHVFVIQAAYQDEYDTVDGKLMKLLFLIKGLKQASASNITVVLPYFPYARGDRKVKPREVVATQAVADFIESAGATGVLTMDVHNLGAYQNAFRIRNDNLEAKNLFATYLVDNDLKNINPEDITILCPDAGGMGRANRLRSTLSILLKVKKESISIAHLDKVRIDGKIEAERIIGKVKGQFVIGIDDMISSGRTMAKALCAAKSEGAKATIAIATHGLCVGANSYLEIPEIEKIILADTIRPFRLSQKVLDKTEIISTTGLFAEAMKRMFLGESLSSLLDEIKGVKNG